MSIDIQQEVTMSPHQYAGFWRRFAAYLIDKILISTVSLAILLPALAFFGVGVGIAALERADREDVLAIVLGALVAWTIIGFVLMIMTWLYFALMESSALQGTLGKMALGIRVTDMDGRRITFGRATGRYFGKVISDLTFGIGYIIAGFTEKKQALHDIMASCLVLLKEQS